MNRETKKDRMKKDQNQLALKTNRRIPLSSISKLATIGQKLRREYEIQCNGCSRDKFPWESWKQYDESRERQLEESNREIERLETLVAKTCNRLRLYYYLQTDPRGATLYVDSEEIPDNNYNRAICLY